GVKAGAQLYERAYTALHGDAPFVGLYQSVQHFQQGGFSCTVVAYETQTLAAAQLKAHVVHGPEFFLRQLSAVAYAKDLGRAILHPVPQRALQVPAELLTYTIYFYEYIAVHCC